MKDNRSHPASAKMNGLAVAAACWILTLVAGCNSERTTPSELKADADQIATHSPGDVFEWPANTTLTALDECVIAMPAAILDPETPIGRIIEGDDDMGFNMPEGDDKVYLQLMPNMSVTIRKSCQAMIVADDANPRRFRVRPASEEN